MRGPKIALKEHLEKIIEMERLVQAQKWNQAQESLKLAREAIDFRLEGMNELRSQINNERGAYVPREIYDKTNELREKRIQDLELLIANMKGRIWAFSFLSAGIVSIIAFFVNLLIKPHL